MQDDIKELKTMVRAIINGQSSMKEDILTKLGNRIDKVELQIKDHRKETKKGFKDINNRGEDFTNLVKRVDKLEKYQNYVTA